MESNLSIRSDNAVTDFERLYISLRTKEQRVYTDEQVRRLPLIEEAHPCYEEWKQRANSASRLIKYLQNKRCKLRVLEIGCGNGWLSARIADIPNTKVIGIDINATELTQAAHVFKKDNLEYRAVEISDIEEGDFDIIVFAASIQYFRSLEQIVKQVLSFLSANGEVHILDTYLYQPSDIGAAMRRSKLYYSGLGFDEMSNYYFHHSIDELKKFNYKILFNPKSLMNKLKGNKTPFFWIRIKNI